EVLRRAGVDSRVDERHETQPADDRQRLLSACAILDDATRDRLISVNPARGAKLPKRTKGRNVYLSAQQLHALADESGRYRALVLLLGTVGLRWGEAAALRVSDVDFLRRRITLHHNAVKVGSEVCVGSLKTG